MTRRHGRWLSRAAVVAILALAAVLAVVSSLYDSITFDEMSHLASGFSYLMTGDFRLAPEHPPLAKVWAALPAVAVGVDWIPPKNPAWVQAEVWESGRFWFHQVVRGERILPASRAMMIALLLATVLACGAIARRLLGRSAALAAMGLAALDPNLLAHGRLVTTDVPIVLLFLLTLLAWDRYLASGGVVRWLLAALALAAAALTKFSWLLVLPALPVMVLVRARAARSAEPEPASARPAEIGAARRAPTDTRRAIVGLLLLAPFVWGAIWCAYGRFDMLRDLRSKPSETAGVIEEQWKLMLEVLRQPRYHGPTIELVALAREWRLLPEAWLHGMAYTLYSTKRRSAYLDGEVSDEGFAAYFPLAVLYKTPLPLLGIGTAGVVVVLLRRREVFARAPVLAWGLVAFGVCYGLVALTGRVHIGIRHVLPLAPLLYVLGGAALTLPFAVRGGLPSAAEAANRHRSRLARGSQAVAVLGVVAALGYGHARCWPDYLSYFSAAAGGPENGHLHLADSNLDWGQDLKRLAAFAAAERSDKPLKLAWFGSSDPTAYGFAVEALPSTLPFRPEAELTAGVYVCSITQLLGVYDPQIRDAFWTDDVRQAYGTLAQICATGVGPAGEQLSQEVLEEGRRELAALRSRRLLNQLRYRPADALVGRTLRVFRLEEAEIARLTAP